MQFNITFDSSVNSAPTGFVATVNAVAQWFQSTFSDAVTVNVTVGYGEVGGSSLSSGALGESLTYLNRYTYSQIRHALTQDAKSADDQSAVNSLPTTDPANASAYWASTAEAKALGLSGASASLDGSVGFSNTSAFDYDRSNGISAGQYDFYGVVAHEFSEIMGRTAELGGTIGGISNSYEPMDLFRYTSSGVRDFVYSHSAYLSPDNGATQLVYENTNPSGDLGDWAASAGADAFLAFSNSGVLNKISNADLRIMDMIGWDLTGAGSPAHTYDNGWTLSGIGDLNGDKHSDLVWIQNSNALLNIELMNGLTPVSSADVTSNPFDSSWHIRAVADTNGDGQADLIWTHNGDGLVEIQLFNGTAPIGGGVIANNPFASGWSVVGAGDTNGDGKADLIWQRQSDGLAEVQFLNGATAIGGGVIANNPFDSNWRIVGTGDFNGDHATDLVWQRASDGLVELHLLNGNATVGGGVISNNPFGAGWTVAGVGDFNGDGKDDLVWQRQSDHLLEIQFLNGTQSMGGGVIANNPFDASWALAGVGDFNGDGHADLVFRRISDGLTEIQFLNGVTPTGGGTTGAMPSSAQAVPLASAVDHDVYFASGDSGPAGFGGIVSASSAPSHAPDGAFAPVAAQDTAPPPVSPTVFGVHQWDHLV